MTNIKELFEAQGEPIKAEDIREGDQIASLWDHDKGYVVSIADAEGETRHIALSHRLLHRPAPVLPTTPGSILADSDGEPAAVLTPAFEWYLSPLGYYRDTEVIRNRLVDGFYTILLDTGATK